MQFTQYACVYTVDRHPVGHITRVVLDPTTKKVTHVVVREGTFFFEDKVIPVEMFQSSGPAGVVLREDVGDLHSLPKFEETSYTEIDTEEDIDTIKTTGILGGIAVYPPARYHVNEMEIPARTIIRHYVRTRKQNIPSGEIALQEGARVISADYHCVGHIESVLVNSQTGLVDHVIVARNLLLRRARKLIPESWIKSVYEDVIYLTVPAEQVKDLPQCA